MNFYNYILFLVFFCLTGSTLEAQTLIQQKVDSVEHLLKSSNKNDTERIVQLSEYILNNTSSDLQKYRTLGVIINSYASKNQKEKSIPYLFRARQLAEKMNDPEMIVRVYGTIASLYASLNLNEKANEYILLSRKQIERLPEGSIKNNLNAFVYSETGTMLYNNKKYLEANTNFKKSLSSYNNLIQTDSSVKTSFFYRNAIYNVGKSYLYIDKPDSSLVYLMRAFLIKDTTQPYLQYYIKTSLAEVYSYTGNPRRSIDSLNNILSDSAFDIGELRSEIYLDLAQNYKQLGDSVHYAQFNEKYVTLSPKIKSEDINAINSVFVAEERKYRLSIVNSQRKNQILLWCVLAIVILSGAIMYFNSRKRKKEASIYREIIHNLKIKRTQVPYSEPTTDSVHVNISTSVEKEILRKLEKFENSEQFTNTKLTLASLAIKLKTNNTYLSEIINREKGKNFNAYINELRIEFICGKILSDANYLKYKISYLAQASGFNSHSAFTTVFKNVTGISPSVFLKNAQQQMEQNNNFKKS